MSIVANMKIGILQDQVKGLRDIVANRTAVENDILLVLNQQEQQIAELQDALEILAKVVKERLP